MECKGLIGKIFGHKYEPRYSTVHVSNTTLKHIKFESWGLSEEFAKELLSPIDKVYHFDVCERCGDVIYTNENKNR